MAPLHLLQISATGTVLIVRFRWRPDPRQRDLLVHVDFADYTGTLDGAAAYLLEHLQQHLVHDTAWFPQKVQSLSAHTALVTIST